MQHPARRLVLLPLLAALLVMALPALPSAAAEGDIVDTVKVNLVVSGASDSAATAVPVLPGLVPVSLAATIVGGTGPTGREGVYTLRSGDASATTPSRTGGAVVLPLTSTSVREGVIPLTLSISILDEDGCPDADIDSENTAAVREVAITYTGAPLNPTTPADFFSAAVKTIALVSAPDKAAFAAPAVLQASATLATTYPRAAISTSPVAPGGPFDRIVEFVPTTGPVVANVDVVGTTPRLTLTGDSAALVPAAAALGSADLALATEPKVAALNQTGTPATSLTYTWADVGAPAPTLAGIGTISESVTLQQIRFGGPISELSVKVLGTHLPAPVNSNNTVSLLINDRLLASTFLGEDDTFELTGLITGNDVRRANQITVEVSAVPIGGQCGSGFADTRVDIDANASTITAVAGQTLNPGFDRFPQVLGDTFPVSFAKGPNDADLANAVAIVSSLSRLPTDPLNVTVVPAEEFLSGDVTGLIVNAGPEESTTLGAPLVYDPVRAPTSTPPEFAVEVGTPFAAFEAFAAGDRNILMLGAYPGDDPDRAASLQGDLATQIAPAPDGWYALTGDVMFTGGSSPEADFLSIAAPTAAESQLAAAEGDDTGAVPAWLWVGLGILALLLLTGLVLWLVSRSARRTPTQSPADESSAPAEKS